MSRKAFTVVQTWGNSSGFWNIDIRSVATGNKFSVYYSSAIKAETGDTISVIIDDNSEKWKTIINERTGDSATVSSFTRL